MDQDNGLIIENKFEMNGHTIVAWKPNGGQDQSGQQGSPVPLRWLIEIDGSASFPGPVYEAFESGQEIRVEYQLRSFLRRDPRAAANDS